MTTVPASTVPASSVSASILPAFSLPATPSLAAPTLIAVSCREGHTLGLYDPRAAQVYRLDPEGLPELLQDLGQWVMAGAEVQSLRREVAHARWQGELGAPGSHECAACRQVQARAADLNKMLAGTWNPAGETPSTPASGLQAAIASLVAEPLRGSAPARSPAAVESGRAPRPGVSQPHLNAPI